MIIVECIIVVVDFYVFNVMLNLYDSEGCILFEKDCQVVEVFMVIQVQFNVFIFFSQEDKFSWFVSEGYYDLQVLVGYDCGFVLVLFVYVWCVLFCFQIFFGVWKFYISYVLKIFDGKYYFEDFVECSVMVVLMLVWGDEQQVWQLMEEIFSGCFQFVILIFFNVGKQQCGELIFCFLLCIEDNMEFIGWVVNLVLQLLKCGGGVVFLFFNLCEVGVLIKCIENQFFGVVLVMKMLEDVFFYVNQFGVCQGVGVVWLYVYYFDILCFFDIWCENVDEKICIKILLLGVVIFDIIFQLVKEDVQMVLFLFYDVEWLYGKFFVDCVIGDFYLQLVVDEWVCKCWICVCDLFQCLVEIQFEFGYLYIMFEDIVNCVSLVVGWVIMSNLCLEILQVSMLFVYNEDFSYVYIGEDIFCNFGLLNIVYIMDLLDFGCIIVIVVCVLIVVFDMSDIQLVFLVVVGNVVFYVIGLGQMNLYGYLVWEGIVYGSLEGLDFINIYFYIVIWYVLYILMQLVCECGQCFVGFEQLCYVSGVYFDKYLQEEWQLKIEWVCMLFVCVGIFLFDWESWCQLCDDVMCYGIYNCYLQVVLFIGLILYINYVIFSIYLIVLKIEICKEGKIGWVYYFVLFMNNDNLVFYQDVYEIGLEKIIDIYVEVMCYVDQGLLLILFFFDIVIICDINKV